MGRGFRAGLIRVHSLCLAQNDAVVDAVLDVGRSVGNAKNALRIGLVLREQEGNFAVAVKIELAQLRMFRGDDPEGPETIHLLERRPVAAGKPRPQIAKPERRQDVQLGRIGAAIVNRDLNENVLGRFLGILDEDVEVAVVVEDPRVDQFVFELALAAAPVPVHEVGIRERRLRIFVEILHVRVRRRAIQIEVVLLDVLAVITLAVGQAEEALLEDRVLAVPQSQGEAKSLLLIGDAGQAVFPPAVGTRARLVMGEVVPGVAAFAVVLADRAPLPFAQVRSPLLPGSLALPSLFQSIVFSRHGCVPQRSRERET